MRSHLCAVLTLILTAGPAGADLWGGRAHSDYEVTYKRIAGIELISQKGLMAGSHEILIPNTTFGDLIVCQLFDAAGLVVETRHENSRSGATRVYITSQEDVASAICATSHVVQSAISSQ